MDKVGKVIEILIANNAKEQLYNLESCRVVEDKGIVGDRYYKQSGTFSEKLKDQEDFHVTFIEKEEIDAFNKLTGYNYKRDVFRRNIVTSGIKLNDLEGKIFEVNGVIFHGMRLCEPCRMLAYELGEEFLKEMVHKSGLRAKLLSSGKIELGSLIKCY